MALTGFQRNILKCLADNRRKTPGSYVAGGVAFNFVLGAPRVSRDIDIFHDTVEALHASWTADCEVLTDAGYDVKPLRELRTFIEVTVSRDGEATEIQWGTDSAYRYFPLQENETTGFILHPLDLATNKLSALVGRAEPRDWIDIITAIRELQPLACLLSAACGKDPGFSPASMLEYVERRHYNQVEIDARILPKGAYDAAELCRFWHASVESARDVLKVFPRTQVGKAVVNKDGSLFNGTDEELKAALEAGTLEFHEGTLGGVWPRIIE